MTVIDPHGRPEPPSAAGETETLLGFLDYQRATLRWRTVGLDAKGLTMTLGPSPMTLGGMLKHLCYAEDIWFWQALTGRPATPPWDTVDWDADPDWD